MMRKIKVKVKMALSFAAGIVSGLMLAVGMTVWATTPGLPGGEALILPLIILLIYFGAQLGTMDRDFREYCRGYDEGYVDGQEDGTIEIHPIKIEVLDADYRQTP